MSIQFPEQRSNNMTRQHSLGSLLLAAMALSIAACDTRGGDANATLDRDLSLSQPAGGDTALSDVPKATATGASAGAGAAGTKAPARPAPGRATNSSATPPKSVEPPVIPLRAPAIDKGASALAAVSGRICTSAAPGDKVTATLSEAMNGSNGAVVPSGATVHLEIAKVAPMTDSTKGVITFRLASIEFEGRTWQAAGSAAPVSDPERTRTTTTGSDVKKVAGGAFIGAVLGQIIGRDRKSTVVGAAAGAAAGTAVAVATGKYEACIAEKAPIRLVLSEALILR
jgi:hypothetical protein